jgi:hypothetical protein
VLIKPFFFFIFPPFSFSPCRKSFVFLIVLL